jgi:hypothetical protein
LQLRSVEPSGGQEGSGCFPALSLWAGGARSGEFALGTVCWQSRFDSPGSPCGWRDSPARQAEGPRRSACAPAEGALGEEDAVALVPDLREEGRLSARV